MKKNRNIFWVHPNPDIFYRKQGEILCSSPVIPRLTAKGIKLTVLTYFDPALLPKTKLAPSRRLNYQIKLADTFNVDMMKISKGSVNPEIYMAKVETSDPTVNSAVFVKAALEFAYQRKKNVDIFHSFGPEGALLPLLLRSTDGETGKFFHNTRTIWTTHVDFHERPFPPDILSYLGIPKELFHPDGLEFYGRVSFVKGGILFSDLTGLIGVAKTRAKHMRTSVNGFHGIIEANRNKIKTWQSERSVQAHLDAYDQVLSSPISEPLLPKIIEKTKQQVHYVPQPNYQELWGPLPPQNYNQNRIGFLIQSPQKAYSFWEWIYKDFSDYGIVLEDCQSGNHWLLSRGLSPKGEFWVDVEPNRQYAVEFFGWDSQGRAHLLMRSQVMKTPRNGVSDNNNIIFVDTRLKKRFRMSGPLNLLEQEVYLGASERRVRIKTPLSLLQQEVGLGASGLFKGASEQWGVSSHGLMFKKKKVLI